jgi:BolA family transcriptional regulator, general stress-responsive regulator
MTDTSTAPIATEMTRRLKAALAPTAMTLIDDSEAHRGHAGHDERGESHYSLTIESEAFAGKSRVERQRLVYAAVGDLMRERVHALTIRATSPEAR